MRRWMPGLAIAVVIACVAVFAASAARSSTLGVAPGDVLVYDLTLEVQMHMVPSAKSSQPALSRVSTVQGTETIKGLRVDASGTMHASIRVVLHGQQAGQPIDLDQTALFEILPDGTTRAEGGSTTLRQYIDLLGQAARPLTSRALHVGDVFHQTVQGITGLVAPVLVTSRVVAQKAYRGYPTFAIQSTGSGKFDASQMGADAAGDVSSAGTTYYDQADAMLIGLADRTDMDVHVAGPQGGELTVMATTNLVLASRSHGGASASHSATAAPAGSPAPSGSPQATATPAPSSTPTPPDEYYTPTPAAATPSPVVAPYPQKT